VGNKPTRKDLAYRALDALVAERDKARRDYEAQREYADEQYRKALAAEAKLELRIEDDAVYRVYDEQVARAEAAEAERDAWKVEALHHNAEEIRLREALQEAKTTTQNRGSR